MLDRQILENVSYALLLVYFKGLFINACLELNFLRPHQILKGHGLYFSFKILVQLEQ